MATRTERCSGCGGTGKAAATGLSCPVCGGRGRVPVGGSPGEGESMRDKRALWEAAGDCRDCGAEGPHRLPAGLPRMPFCAGEACQHRLPSRVEPRFYAHTLRRRVRAVCRLGASHRGTRLGGSMAILIPLGAAALCLSRGEGSGGRSREVGSHGALFEGYRANRPAKIREVCVTAEDDCVTAEDDCVTAQRPALWSP